MIPIQIKSKRRTKQLNVANGNGPNGKVHLWMLFQHYMNYPLYNAKRIWIMGLNLKLRYYWNNVYMMAQVLQVIASKHIKGHADFTNISLHTSHHTKQSTSVNNNFYLEDITFCWSLSTMELKYIAFTLFVLVLANVNGHRRPSRFGGTCLYLTKR